MRKIAATVIASLALVLSFAPIAGAASTAPAGDPIPTCNATEFPPTAFPCNPPAEDINCLPYIETYGVQALSEHNLYLQAQMDWEHAYTRANRLAERVTVQDQRLTELRRENRRLRAELRHAHH
jgi:hypothetical protein